MSTELPRLEHKEQVISETKIISPDELLEIIYKGTSFPQDKRFLPVEDGGVFAYFSTRDIADLAGPAPEQYYVAVCEGDTIAGLSKLEHDPKNKQNIWIKFVSVDPLYQGRGYASKLLRQIFDFAKDGGYTLDPSMYSQQGLEKLKPVIERLSLETGVVLVNQR